MGHFASRAVVYVTVEGASGTAPESGEYIAIKSALTLDEQAELQGALVRMGDDQKVTMAPSEYLKMLNAVAIVGWRLFDEPGVEMPFERARIGDLDCNDPLVDAALKEFVQRNPTLARGRGRSGSTS